MPIPDSVFQQVAALLAICAVVGFVAQRLRQPLVVGFIAAGILVGPQALGLVQETEQIELLAQIGIALLLFVVGLKLDLRVVRTLGPVALATGMGQVIFTSAIGYLLAIVLGFEPLAALYVAVALTFSSTIIIVKLLTDKGELEALHGRIAIGFLIVQDLVVVLVMIGLTAFADTGDTGFAAQLLGVAVRGSLFLGAIAVLMRWVLPALLHRLAHSAEMLVLFAVAWAIALAAAGESLGFSEEVGAFLAGVSLATTPYRDALGARLSSLRDFLLLFFFIDLGAQVDFADAGAQLPAALLLSAFVLIGNPIIVMAIMGIMRYPARVSFRAGLTVAQISEFSLILVALGLSLDHIDATTAGLVTTVGLITIGSSTYLIYNSGALYERFGPMLSVFERRAADAHRALEDTAEAPSPYVVFGLGRYGSTLLDRLRAAGHEPMGVDFDPQALERWAAEGIRVCYGDAHDPHVHELLPLEHTRWVISTVRDTDANLSLVQSLRQHGYQGFIAAAALSDQDHERLAEAGADHVLRPFVDAAGDAMRVLERLDGGDDDPRPRAR